MDTGSSNSASANSNGLLINFDPSLLANPKSNKRFNHAKSWAQRHKGGPMKRMTSHSAANKTPISSSKALELESKREDRSRQIKPRPTKPVQNKLDADPSNKSHPLNSNTKTAPASSLHPNDWVSSLFTKNPDAKNFKSSEDTIKNALPSNAPLSDPEVDDLLKLGVDNRLVSTLESKLKITSPTEIQKKAIVELRGASKGEFIVQSQTGSGKTLAFLLPILTRMLAVSPDKGSRKGGLWAMILAPTRELALQTSNVLSKLLSHPSAHWIVGCTVVGGERKKAEKSRIRKGANILIGTPGRVLDHLKTTESLNIKNLRWLVLDEGDRLVEMGLGETVHQIIEILQENSQSYRISDSMPSSLVRILCSATISKETKELARFTTEPVLIAESKSKITNYQIPAQLDQTFLICAAKLRLTTLAALLKSCSTMKRIIVFFSCISSVEFHFKLLTKASNAMETCMAPANSLDSKYTIFKIHGNMEQSKRLQSIKSFVEPSSDTFILFTTDVASRGLDLPDIDLVVQYDPPFTTEDYIHRIGRSARAGQKGSAILFLLPDEAAYTQHLVDKKEMNIRQNSKSITEWLKSAFNVKKDLEAENRATEWQIDQEKFTIEDSEMSKLAKEAFQAHVRAYATHASAEKIYFHPKMLHLGHLAKSFALRETPTGISRAQQKNNKRSIEKAKMRDDEREPKKPKSISKNMEVHVSKSAKTNLVDEFNTSISGYDI